MLRSCKEEFCPHSLSFLYFSPSSKPERLNSISASCSASASLLLSKNSARASADSVAIARSWPAVFACPSAARRKSAAFGAVEVRLVRRCLVFLVFDASVSGPGAAPDVPIRWQPEVPAVPRRGPGPRARAPGPGLGQPGASVTAPRQRRARCADSERTLAESPRPPGRRPDSRCPLRVGRHRHRT